jgi:hypothetical protein
VEDREEKILALSSFTNHIVPGRWDSVRAVRDSEIKATSVLKILLREVSAKVRVGPPKDEAEDYALPIWAGVLPLKLTAGAPIADPKLPEGIGVPESLKNYSRSRT